MNVRFAIGGISMKKKVVCKACGYVMDEASLRDRCPACGVGRQAFEPYQSRISEKREFILGLDIHPIVVHFPQAFTYTIPVVILLGLIVPAWKEALSASSRVLILGLPFVVVFGLVTGIMDGVARFKKVRTPSLIRKIIIAALFLAASCVLAASTLAGGTAGLLAWVLILVCMACAASLGMIGSKLISSKLPG